MDEVLRLCRQRNLTRLPVWQDTGNRRRIVGVVSLKTLLYQSDLDVKRTAGDYVKPALYLSEGMRLEEALRRMQVALESFIIEGITTTIPFLARVMADPFFQAGDVDTKFLEREAHLLKEPT